jgi:tRNA(Ile)-lysidine synthase
MFSPGSFRSRFHEFSRKHGLFGERDIVVVAVSGGIDSMVLLDLLAGEQGLRLIVAHVNHGLRGAASDADETLVRDQAGARALEFRVDRPNIAAAAEASGTGIQETARRLRYAFLETVRAGAENGKIATGHQLDDDAETILLNLFRGTGIRGLAGIPVRREHIIRPLLFAARDEVERYAAAAGVPFREDASNATDAYTRNAIRRQILPRVREFVSPGASRNIARTGEILRMAAGYLAEQTATALTTCRLADDAGGMVLSVGRLRDLHPFLCREVLLAAADQSGTDGLSSAHVEAVMSLLDARPGDRVTLPGGWTVARERETFLLRRAAGIAGFCIPVTPGTAYEMAGFRFSSTIGTRREPAEPGTEVVDADRLGVRGLTLRSWREGDAFVPLGMTARKKLSDFFIDEKIEAHRKHLIPILETADGEIVWVCGMRIDERFKVTATTRRVLRLEYSSFAER